MTKEELTSNGWDEGDACDLAGTYSLAVIGDQWTINQTPVSGCTLRRNMISGTWRISGEQVSFHEDRNAGCPQDYVYKWSFQGSELQLTQVQDTCSARIVLLTNHSWVKAK